MPNWLEVIINILISATMLVGLFGLVIPIFPGNAVMWIAALIFDLFCDHHHPDDCRHAGG